MSRRRGRPRKIYCILCENEVKKTDKKWVVAIDRPIRLDIPVHRECFEKTNEKSLKSAVKQHIKGIL